MNRLLKPGLGAIVSIFTLTAAPHAAGQDSAMPVSAPTSGPWTLRIGERVRGATADGRPLDGRVLSQTDSDFVVGRRAHAWTGVGGDSTRASFERLARLEVRRPPRWRTTAVSVGTAGGLALGAFLGWQSVQTECSGNGIGPCFNHGDGAMIGALLGAGLGSGVSLLLSRSRWFPLTVQAPRSP